jgi:NADH dehydrogenase/NADH:ubiquinone oxidoreductase subunit G
MVTLTIDGRTCRVAEASCLLDAARAAGIDIPKLCHHPALDAWGGCRLCLVEVTKDTWGGDSKLVASCMYPAENGLVVRSQTDRVRAARAVVLDLLLARCPDTPLVRRLAREYGLERTSYRVAAVPTDCVLCGLCTRVCDHIGVSAIASVNRGVGREIAPPFDRPPDACIGCLACAQICPTGHIHYETSDAARTIWGRRFEMTRCKGCGRAHITREQATRASERHGVPAEDLELCEVCKRRRTAATFAAVQAPAPGMGGRP